MKTLAQYLTDKGIRQSDFARGWISKSYLNEIVKGTKTPSLPVAFQIEDATKGQVKARSLIARDISEDANGDD